MMLLLTTISDKLQVVTSAAVATDVHASYVDATTAGAITPDRKNTAISTVATTDVVLSPLGSTQRNVKFLSVRNKHASTSQTATVVHTDGSTAVELIKCTLLAGEELCFDEASGWKHFTAAGSIKFDPLPSVSDAQLMANTSGGTAAPIGTALSAYLDYVLGSSVGGALVRGTGGWAAAAGSTAGQVLTNQGASSPAWADPASGPPNLFINPFFEIDQANEGASVSPATNGTLIYVADGCQASLLTGSAVVTAQRVTDAPAGATNSVKLTVTTGAAVGAGHVLMFEVPLDGSQITGTSFGTASAQQLYLSFWVKSSIGSYVASAAFRNALSNRSYPVNFTINSAGVWERKTIPIPGDTAGSWTLSGASKAMVVDFVATTGPTFQGTNATWAGTNLVGTSSNTNTILSTNGATFQIANIKLEVGPAATPIMRDPVELMLLRCQRQYEKSYDPGVLLGASGVGNGQVVIPTITGTYQARSTIPFKVTKRAAPTMAVRSTVNGGTSGAFNTSSGTDVALSSATGGFNAADAIFNSAALTTGGVLAFQWWADARL